MVRNRFFSPRRVVSLMVLFLLYLGACAVDLVPPVLDNQLIIKAFCDRPKRAQGIALYAEQVAGKKIIHCYGHGGSGFTTLFGSTQEALRLFDEQGIDTHEQIHIIGAGCMGLSLAIELHRKGFCALTVSAKELYDIPSWRAGGFFDPGTGKESNPIDQYRVKLGLMTYETLCSIESGTHPYLTSAIVRRLPVYAPVTTICGTEILEQRGYMPLPEPVEITFGNGVVHENYMRHYTYFINVAQLMKELWQQVHARGISVIKQELQSFDECPESVVCNCAGLGAGVLNNDATVYPVRGHFYMLPYTSDELAIDYMLFAKMQQGDKKESIYLFPKDTFVSSDCQAGSACSGMLGATFIKDIDTLSDEDEAALNEREWDRLLLRARAFFYGTTIDGTAN